MDHAELGLTMDQIGLTTDRRGLTTDWKGVIILNASVSLLLKVVWVCGPNIFVFGGWVGDWCIHFIVWVYVWVVIVVTEQ